MSAQKKPQSPSYIVGIDEVGRGPLAGPVVVCAVAIPRSLRVSSLARTTPLRDSKKLSASQRAIWHDAISTHPSIHFVTASASPQVIDRINVSNAANHSATRALVKILLTFPSRSRVSLFLDGGLFIARDSRFELLASKNTTKKKYQSRFHNFKTGTFIDLSVETIVKGDEKVPAISLASIMAKQYRDTLMRRAHKKYPQYGFDTHVGYGTKKHIAAIRIHGHTSLHRKSFLKKIT